MKERLLLYRLASVSATYKKKNETNKFVVDIFTEYLTNHDILLAEKYVCGFLIGSKIKHDDDISVLLSNMFVQIKNSNGYNFNMLIKYFRFYFIGMKMNLFIKHMSLKEHVKFFIKLTCYCINNIWWKTACFVNR